MKRSSIFLASIAIAFAVQAQRQVGEEPISVEGIVMGIEDSLPLPYCRVTYFLDGQVVASRQADAGGRYALGEVPPGNYSILISSLGDTVLFCRDLRLDRSALVRSLGRTPALAAYVDPMDVDHLEAILRMDSVITLNAVSVSVPGIKLLQSGMLITSPRDARLWNFSGKMGNPRPASIALMLDEYAQVDNMPLVLVQFLAFGRKLYLGPPFWELFPDTRIPPPKEAEARPDSGQEADEE